MPETIWAGKIHFGDTDVPVKLRPAVGRASARPENGRTIEVCEFIKAGEINPVFMERTFYLEPAGPAGGYNALATALREMEAEGVCIWTMGKRACLGSLHAAGRRLRLSLLRYDDEAAPAGPAKWTGPERRENT